MYESLPVNSPAKVYLEDNCSHCLKPLTGDTGFSKLICHHDTIFNSLNTHSLINGPSIANQYTDSGLYVFIDPETGEMYIGSSTKFYSRLANHFSDSKELPRPLYERARSLGGLEKFNWHVPYTQTNHESSFILNNPNLAGNNALRLVLRSFTQYELYAREQALISYYGTDINGLNGKGSVTFTFNNWQSTQLELTGDLNLYLYFNDGTLVTDEPMTSVNKASEFLGVDRRDFNRYINLEDHFIRSPNLENKLVRIFDPNREMREGILRLSPYDRVAIGSDMLPNGITPAEIPADVVYVFEKGNINIFDVYDSPTSASKAMGLEYYQITRNINKNYLVCASAAAISTMVGKYFTVWQNPLCTGNSKRVKGEFNGVTRVYDSVNQCVNIISPKSDPSNLGKKLRKAGLAGVNFKGHNLKMVRYTIPQFDWSTKLIY